MINKFKNNTKKLPFTVVIFFISIAFIAYIAFNGSKELTEKKPERELLFESFYSFMSEEQFSSALSKKSTVAKELELGKLKVIAVSGYCIQLKVCGLLIAEFFENKLGRISFEGSLKNYDYIEALKKKNAFESNSNRKAYFFITKNETAKIWFDDIRISENIDKHTH